MTDYTQRRHPPPKPPHLGPPPKPGKIDAASLATFWQWGRELGANLDRLWSHVSHVYDGLPAPHAKTHASGGGDALTNEAFEDAEVLAWMAFLRHDEGKL